MVEGWKVCIGYHASIYCCGLGKWVQLGWLQVFELKNGPRTSIWIDKWWLGGAW
jgi:hypothetical protein